MELLAALFICGSIGGLGFVLMTVWFKKYEELLESRQERAQKALQDLLREHAEAVNSKQNQLLEEQMTLLKAQQSEFLQAQTEILSRLNNTNVQSQDFGPLKDLIEHNSRIAEVQVIAQLLPLFASNAEASKALELAASFLDNREIVQEIQRLSQAQPVRLTAAPIPVQSYTLNDASKLQPESAVTTPAGLSPDSSTSSNSLPLQSSSKLTEPLKPELNPEEHIALMLAQQEAETKAASAAGWVALPLAQLSRSISSEQSQAAPSVLDETEQSPQIQEEAKRQNEQTEQKRQAEEAEQKRQAEQAEQKRQNEHADTVESTLDEGDQATLRLFGEQSTPPAGALLNLSDAAVNGIFENLLSGFDEAEGSASSGKAAESKAAEAAVATNETDARQLTETAESESPVFSEGKAHITGQQSMLSARAQDSLLQVSDQELGAAFDNLFADDSQEKASRESVSNETSEPSEAEKSLPDQKIVQKNTSPDPEASSQETLLPKLGSKSERESRSDAEAAAATARLFGGINESKNQDKNDSLLRVSEEELAEAFDNLFSEDSSEKTRASIRMAPGLGTGTGAAYESPAPDTAQDKQEEAELAPSTNAAAAENYQSDIDHQRKREEEEAAARLFGGAEGSKGLFSLSDQELSGMFDELISDDSDEKLSAINPVKKFEKEQELRRKTGQIAKFDAAPVQSDGSADKEPDSTAKTTEEQEAEARLFGNLFADSPAPVQRDKQGAEKKSDSNRNRNLTETAAAQLKNEELEDTMRLPADELPGLDNKQIAMAAAERKLAALAALSGRDQTAFEQQRDQEAEKLLEESEALKAPESLDPATQRLMNLEASGEYQPYQSDTNFDHQTIEQPFSEAFLQDGNRLYAQGKYVEADKHYRAALPTLEEVMGREHLAVVEILHRLALIAIRRGKYADAEETLQQALVRRMLGLGEQHPDTVSTLNDLGELYLKRANYAEAKRTLSEALEKRRKVLGDEHRMTAQTCHNMALFHLEMGAYNDAIILMDKALKIRRSVLGEQHQDTMQSLNDTAKLLLKLDRLTEAEKIVKEVLQYRKDNCGEDHPEFADTLMVYCELLLREGRYRDAIPLATHVLNVRKKSLGERHPETAGAFNLLGRLYYHIDDLDEAKRNLTQALYVRKTTLTENHPASAAAMHDFGRLCWRLGMLGDDTQFAEGMPLIEKSFNIRAKFLGDDHPDSLQSVCSSAEMLTALSSPQEAEPLLRVALLKRKEIFGLNHLSVAESNHALAACLLQMDRADEAKPLLDEELLVRSNVLGSDNPLVSRAKAESLKLLSSASSA